MSKKYEVIEIEQRSPEWVGLRNKYIGASDAPIIMGESPWKTPFQLWQEKLAIKKMDAPNQSMERGISLEDEARESFIKQTGIEVKPMVAKSLVHPWMLSSFDGVSANHDVIVEIKCPGMNDHANACNGLIPSKYLAQLFHQMITLGIDKAYYFSYTSLSSKLLEININLKYSISLLEKEKEFFKCMQELEAPEMTKKDYKQIIDLNFIRAAAEWRDLQSQLKSMEKKEKYLREQLINMSGDSNAMGGGIKMSQILRKGSIDYKSIPEIQGMDLDKYRKDPVKVWRIGEC